MIVKRSFSKQILQPIAYSGAIHPDSSLAECFNAQGATKLTQQFSARGLLQHQCLPGPFALIVCSAPALQSQQGHP